MKPTAWRWKLFRVCGYCAPNVPIPDDVLAGAAGQDDSEVFEFALRRLADLGLALQGEEGMLVHPLLAEFDRVQDGSVPESALPALMDALGTLSYQALVSEIPANCVSLRPPSAGSGRCGARCRAGIGWKTVEPPWFAFSSCC